MGEHSPEAQSRHTRQPLGQILVARGVITREQLTEALKAQRLSGKRLGDTLRTMGVSSDQIAEALSEQLMIPLVRLRNQTIDKAVLQLIPERMARRHQAIPIEASDARIIVAIVDPLDIVAIDDLRRLTGQEIDIVIATPDDFNLAISQYSALEGAVEETIRELPTAQVESQDVSADALLHMVEEAPIVRLVSMILSKAIRQRASDIHIEPQERHLRVRIRVDGLLATMMMPPKHVQAAVVSRVKILSGMDISERRLPQDGRIQMKVDDKEVDIRVSTMPTVYGEKAVMRVLDRSSGLVSLDRLGLSPHNRARIVAIANRPHGLFLTTGPTGSGKTTALYAILNMLNVPERNIVTIEDPVEYHVAGITQVQVNPKAGLTFAGGLRSYLRQDPDVIMVGEIRDAETAAIAVQAAMTGHLVLSTLHTNDAPGAVTRLLDMGIEPYLVASVLIGVSAQRLARLLCPECKEAVVLEPNVAARLGLPVNGEPVKVYRPRGCAECGDVGYRGRTALFEFMDVTEEIQTAIVRGAAQGELRSAAACSGMRSLLEDGTQKVLAGLTSAAELFRILETAT